MKFSDLNDNLNEGPISGPAGFAQRAKAKLQKHGTPFMKQQQKRGKAKDALFKKAKDIKNKLKVWMDKIGKPEIGMKTFLDWMQQSHPEEAEGVLAAAKEIHTNLFPKAPEKEKQDIQKQVPTDGINYSTEVDQKGAPVKKKKAERSPEEEEQIKKAYGPGGTVAKGAEAEAKKLSSEDDTQDLKASKGDDEKPKVDTSASIYESRFRTMLEAETDQSLAASADGEISNDPLKDDQIDTLIVKGLQKQKELAGTGASKVAAKQTEPAAGEEPTEPAAGKKEPAAGKEKPAAGKAKTTSSGDSGPELGSVPIPKIWARNAKEIFKKVQAGEELNNKDIKNATELLKFF